MLLYQAVTGGVIDQEIFLKSVSIANVLGFENVISDYTHFDSYFIYFYQYIFLIQCVFCVLLGVDILRKEEMNNTIQYLYSMPISRSKIYFSKYISALLLYTIFLLITWIVFFCLIAVLQSSFISTLFFTQKVWLLIFYTYLIGAAYLTLGLFVSLLLKTSANSVITGIILFLIIYIIGFSKELEYFSLYKYINPGRYLYSFHIFKAVLLISIIIVLLIAGLIIYIKRDFKINKKRSKV
jgi:ABC-2 type transport system permease protein